MFSNHSTMEYCYQLFEYYRTAYVTAFLGPQTVPQWCRYTFGTIYTALLLTGVFGNIAICVVISLNRHMHRSTNFYLFSLSISDLLILLFGLPIELLQNLTVVYPWKLGQFLCHTRILISELTPLASVLTITAFSLERYLAICYPLRAHLLSSRRRTAYIIFFTWLIALLLAFPINLMSHYGEYLTYQNLSTSYNITQLQNIINNITQSCTEGQEQIPAWFLPGSPVSESLMCYPNTEAVGFKELLTILAVLFFIVPFFMIITLYTLIVRKLFFSSSTHISDRNHSKMIDSRKAIIKMLAMVVVSFFICWAPYHLQRLLMMHASNEIRSAPFTVPLYYISGSLLYISPTINPIIYNLMSVRFRNTSIATLQRLCCYSKCCHSCPLYQTFLNLTNQYMYNTYPYSNHHLNTYHQGCTNNNNNNNNSARYSRTSLTPSIYQTRQIQTLQQRYNTTTSNTLLSTPTPNEQKDTTTKQLITRNRSYESLLPKCDLLTNKNQLSHSPSSTCCFKTTQTLNESTSCKLTNNKTIGHKLNIGKKKQSFFQIKKKYNKRKLKSEHKKLTVEQVPMITMTMSTSC